MASIQRLTKKRLGEVLLNKGVVKEEAIAEALAEQAATGELIGEILVRRGVVGEMEIVETICSQFSLPFISFSQYYVPGEIMRLVPADLLEKHLIAPLDRFGDVLAIVLAGPVDFDVFEEIEKITGCTVQVYVGTSNDVRQAIERCKAAQSKKIQTGPGQAADTTKEPETAGAT